MWNDSLTAQESGVPAHESCPAPESRLMLAVLQDALATFERDLYASEGRDIESFREVDRWFRSRDYDSPFSFECICSTLEIDPGCVRAWLNKLKVKAFTNRAVSKGRTMSSERLYTRRSWGEQPDLHG